MKVSLIWAMSENRVIGKCNRLPWRLPDELQYFKDTVRGSPIIMGRKTFEGVGKPIKDCLNIVLSKSRSEFSGCIQATNLKDAIEAARTAEEAQLSNEVFVIGGTSVYEEALPLATRLYRTTIEAEIEGDTFFPIY
ncbi:MAG: dihydrofolate reductase, partial [Gammaproteobacteria bacterium]|nr:dihydrofolate reductase [Gammaproteobacteria bacterium]